MDVDLARTFLAISETDHFGRAARALNITQSTVSARIKTLEDELGQRLFVRSKLGTTLTPAGAKFKNSAELMIRVWEHACQQVSLASDFHSVINVGVELTLWQQLLLNWLPWVRSSLTDVAVRTEITEPDRLVKNLIEGTFDIGLTYVPVSRAGFKSEILIDEELNLISAGDFDIQPGHPGYVYIDWNSTFRAQHDSVFAGLEMPALTMSPSRLGLNYIVDNRGSGYFPLRLAAPFIEAGTAHIVDSAPKFQQRAHLVYDSERKDEWFDTALQGLRFIAAREVKG